MGNGGGVKAVRFLTNANLAAGHASIVFWSTQADLKMANRLFLYRVTDTSSNILHSSSSQRDEIRRVPRTITTNDTLALFHFFDVMAYTSIADSMQLCDHLADKCALPNVKPHGTEIIV